VTLVPLPPITARWVNQDGTPTQVFALAMAQLFNQLRSYTSPPQTITSGGTLTLAHGLGAVPTYVQLRLVCVNAENGYNPGDEVVMNNATIPSGNQGVALIPDVTNLNVVYASGGSVFMAVDKVTGAVANLTNANWRAVFRAWIL